VDVILPEKDFEAFLNKMAVVRQDFGDSMAAHRCHRYAIHDSRDCG
jgi:hypothetical protein